MKIHTSLIQPCRFVQILAQLSETPFWQAASPRTQVRDMSTHTSISCLILQTVEEGNFIMSLRLSVARADDFSCKGNTSSIDADEIEGETGGMQHSHGPTDVIFYKERSDAEK